MGRLRPVTLQAWERTSHAEMMRGSPGGLPHRSPRTRTALVRELTSQLVETSSEAAQLRTRLELTERAGSSLEEEAQALREERDRLRQELEAERSKGFWARLFGG